MEPTRERFCADCHGTLDARLTDTALGNASDFGKAHPQFQAAADHQRRTGRAGAGLARRAPAAVERAALPARRCTSIARGGVTQMARRLGTRNGYGEALECNDCHRPTADGVRLPAGRHGERLRELPQPGDRPGRRHLPQGPPRRRRAGARRAAGARPGEPPADRQRPRPAGPVRRRAALPRRVRRPRDRRGAAGAGDGQGRAVRRMPHAGRRARARSRSCRSPSRRAISCTAGSITRTHKQEQCTSCHAARQLGRLVRPAAAGHRASAAIATRAKARARRRCHRAAQCAIATIRARDRPPRRRESRAGEGSHEREEAAREQTAAGGRGDADRADDRYPYRLRAGREAGGTQPRPLPRHAARAARRARTGPTCWC